MKELHNNIKTSRVISPAAAITGNGTTTGEIIDTQGFHSHEFVFASGAITDGSFTLTVFEGDAANMSDEAAVVAADLLGTVAAASFAATDDNVTKKIGYVGTKRYIRPKMVQADATSGGFLSAVCVQGHPRNAP